MLAQYIYQNTVWISDYQVSIKLEDGWQAPEAGSSFNLSSKSSHNLEKFHAYTHNARVCLIGDPSRHKFVWIRREFKQRVLFFASMSQMLTCHIIIMRINTMQHLQGFCRALGENMKISVNLLPIKERNQEKKLISQEKNKVQDLWKYTLFKFLINLLGRKTN